METSRVYGGSHRRLGAALATSLALIGCSGEIVGPGGDNPSTGPNPSGAGPGGGPVVVPPPEGVTLGPSLVRRLTRTEYNNTVRDLLGTSLTPADEFQGDIGADGFDNAASTQTIGPAHLESFERAAATLVEAAFANPTQRARIVSCDLATGNSCIRESLEAFLPRAWRRPVQTAEVDRLIALAQTEALAGGNAEEQLKLALRGALTSANFLYLIERDQNPLSPEPHPITDHELASRLSYFLWSSMPDNALFDAARQGVLQDDTVLRQHVTRMLADMKAASITDVFGDQWLQLSKLGTHQPLPDLFPTVTEELKAAMAGETRLFFNSLMSLGGVVRSLLGADYTFVNPLLAEHYGLPAPPTGDFSQVSVVGTNRIGGVLGHSSILMLSSGLKATSAVKRGEWVLENVLCAPAPPPPPDIAEEIVQNQEELEALAEQLTAREFLAEHRADPACATCHSLIDPLGLALENYDPIGRYREMDKGKVIDPAGTLADGTPFADARELTALLANDPRLARCVAEKVFTFAMGRTPTKGDSHYVETFAETNDAPLINIVANVVLSAPFRMRR